MYQMKQTNPLLNQLTVADHRPLSSQSKTEKINHNIISYMAQNYSPPDQYLELLFQEVSA